MAAHNDFEALRSSMVAEQLAARDIDDQRLLGAMGRVPRHEFVPDSQRASAYDDRPLPIGHDATISQPYIVALMTQTLRLEPTDRVLEIGTGSGYGAAVLAELCAHVTTVEYEPSLAAAARRRLAPYAEQVEVVDADGSLGYLPNAPYDAICVTAGAPALPTPLTEQLGRGGRLIIPIEAGGHQELVLVIRDSETDELETRVVAEVRFVPLIGEHGYRPR